MTDLNHLVRTHYQASIDNERDLLLRVARALGELGEPFSSARLASIDQFHVGGLRATAALAARVSPVTGTRVLDAGSGLGGPARFLAETYACEVMGVDLSPHYVSVAQYLSERAHLAERTRFAVGDLVQLAMPDASFDLVWTQHVVMNIRDRLGLYRELRRVLRTDGKFAFYDVLADDHGLSVHYPVPWAESAQTSTLLTSTETRAVLEAAGFTIRTWDDVSEEAVGWMSAQTSATGPSPSIVVGERMAAMGKNFRLNLLEGRVRLVMGVCTTTHPDSRSNV